MRAADWSYPVEYGRTKVRQYPLDFGAGTLTRSATVPDTLEVNGRLLDSDPYPALALTAAMVRSPFLRAKGA